MRKYTICYWIGLIGIALLLFIYMRWIEPYWIDVRVCRVKLLKHKKQKIRILHLSDLHVSDQVPLKYIAKVMKRGIGMNPDLIILTGDYFSGKQSEDIIYSKYYQEYVAILKELTQLAPTFACLGNHDGGVWAGYDENIIKEFHKQAKIALLHNRNVQINIKGTVLSLIGVGDLWAGNFHPEQAFDHLTEGDLSIVLVHNPDTKEQLRDYPWQIMLSGHSHGGQFRLPLLGTPFAPVEDKKFVYGLKSWEGRWIHVTRGIGNLFGLRFNCRPEISIIDIE